jgi:hypothetical protein
MSDFECTTSLVLSINCSPEVKLLNCRNHYLVLETHQRSDGEDGRATDEAYAVLVDRICRRTSDANTLMLRTISQGPCDIILIQLGVFPYFAGADIMRWLAHRRR